MNQRRIVNSFNKGGALFRNNSVGIGTVKGSQKKETATETEKKHKCYDCQTVFKTKNEMMTHRINVHTNKVKLCRDPENCSFTKCWYRHTSSSTRDLNQESTNEPSNVNNVNNINQTKTNDQDFSKAPANPEPPLFSQR